MYKAFSFSLADPFLFLQQVGAHFAHHEGSCFLYSGEGFNSAEHSFFFLCPLEKCSIPAESKNPWSALKNSMNFSIASPSIIPEWVGFLAYEMGYTADPDFEIRGPNSSIPLALFYKAGCVVKVFHKEKYAEVFLQEKNVEHFEGSSSLFWASLLATKPHMNFFSAEIESFEASDTRESYLEKIATAQEWIVEGNIYQVNLSQQFKINYSQDINSFSLYISLLKLNPTPFSAYFNLGLQCVISTSPERFLKKKGSTLQTRPIKGTMPRGKTIQEDSILKKALHDSEKERAELLMITDLMRNDLSKVCSFGSVEAHDMWTVETYANVFHLVSAVEGESRLGMNCFDIIRALFPGGSITGCPKLKAMELIATLEKRSRGIYTGSLGYFTESGDFDFNIAIRTLVLTQEKSSTQLSLQLGGGIVWDSNPEKEFEETLHKGQSLFRVLGIREFIF